MEGVSPLPLGARVHVPLIQSFRGRRRPLPQLEVQACKVTLTTAVRLLPQLYFLVLLVLLSLTSIPKCTKSLKHTQNRTELRTKRPKSVCDCDWGSAPDTAGGAYDALPDLLVG